MSFIKLTNNFFENSTLALRPNIRFVSSSIDGLKATGSMYVSPVRSKCIKSTMDLNAVSANATTDRSFDLTTYEIINSINDAATEIRNQSSTNISRYMNAYMNAVNSIQKIQN